MEPDYNNPFVFILIGFLVVFGICISVSLLPMWLGASLILSIGGAVIAFIVWAGMNGHLD